MAQHSSYIAGVQYAPADMLQRDNDWISPGVVSLNDLIVSVGSNLTVTVTGAAQGSVGGNAWLPGGYRFYNDTTATVTLAAANVTNPRIDLIVAGIDTTQSPYSPTVTAITGTASATPTIPIIPGTFIGIVLAQVYVNANATTLTASNLTDVRVVAGLKSDSTVATPSIAYGMNNKINISSVGSVSPRFTMVGKTVINLLGKDGNCEDVSKWNDVNSTHVLDSTNKVFGSNGLKVTLTSTSGTINKILSTWNIDTSKYYLVSAHFKNGNSTGGIKIYKDNSSGGSMVGMSTAITDTTKFTRAGFVLQPTDINVGNFLNTTLTGTSGQYAYVDGIMINEITSTEYALGATALLANYPYVDSYSCLQNPYIEIRHDNLVRSGNGEEGVAWWNKTVGDGALSVVNGKLQVTSPTIVSWFSQCIQVKPNTNYYFSANKTNITVNLSNADNTVNILANTVGTFNSGTNTQVYIGMSSAIGVTGILDSIMLIEGTTPPTSYKSCRLERTVIEGKFTSDDSLVYDNGEVSGLINWKHKVLFGKDYDWGYAWDGNGYKKILVSGFMDRINLGQNDISNLIVSKYDGKILSKTLTDSTDNCYFLNANNLNIFISDTDTGWVEAINPNSDEVKAFMNGWKALHNNGTRYDLWYCVPPNSTPTSLSELPPGTASTLTVATTGTTSVTVTDASMFKIGDAICVLGNATTTISNVVGNVLTLANAQTAQAIGTVVARMDIPATDTRILNYCKNNVAPNYEGYQLHYKLANPEPITDVNTSIQGDIPKFDIGDNYLYLDSGIVLGEVANPQLYSSVYYISDNTVSSNLNLGNLKNKNEKIYTGYKNNVYDGNWLFVNAVQGYGNQWGQINQANFDTSAQYTVDYKILATQAPQVGSIACSYSQDIVSAISDLKEEVGSRQAKDSALDTLVDLSVYEIRTITYILCNWYTSNNSQAWVQVIIPFLPKKITPNISLKSFWLNSGVNGDVTSKFILESVSWIGSGVALKYTTTDSTTITNLKANGVQCGGTIIADCSKRI